MGQDRTNGMIMEDSRSDVMAQSESLGGNHQKRQQTIDLYDMNSGPRNSSSKPDDPKLSEITD